MRGRLLCQIHNMVMNFSYIYEIKVLIPAFSVEYHRVKSLREEDMKATDILMEEHRVIEHVLISLETAAVRLHKGETVRPGFFVDAADFIKGFADGCHHRKEEGVLFTALVDAGLPTRVGPIPMMLAEHERGRAYTQGMRAAAQRLAEGDAAAQGEVVSNALGYVGLLREHIGKEDNILFPMAAEVIPQDQQAALLERFETIEHEETGEGVHERFLALAGALGQEANR